MNEKKKSDKKGRLIILSAPSGAGKTTLCQRLVSEFPNSLVLSISCTTRVKRGPEKNGVDYFFISEEEFEKKIKSGSFAEWAKVHQCYYGTPREFIETSLKDGKHVVLDIDVQGARTLKKKFSKEAVSFFIKTPDLKTLETRLRARGTESEEKVQKRMRTATEEMKQIGDFDYVVVNDNLDRAYQELKQHLQKQGIP